MAAIINDYSCKCKMAKFYAVRKGRIPGIYTTWDDCKKNTDGYPMAEFKSFKTANEAAVYLGMVSEQKALKKQDSVSDEDTLVAYVDGSYNIATKVYGYGAVLISGGTITKLYEKGMDSELATMRNVAGEIKGSEAAMRYAVENGYKKVIIYHDYEGIAKWCQGLWKTNKEGTKSYKKVYDELSKYVEVEFVKVKGHSGDKYNDMADELAKKAAGVE